MTESLQHQKDTESRVVKAAPHPKQKGVNPDEYYMTDPPRGSDCMFLPYPGMTHAVFYTATFGGGPTVQCHALENWQAVNRFVTESWRSGVLLANRPEEIVADLRRKADQLEQWLNNNPQPVPAEFQGMPYAGMSVWVEHPGKPGVMVDVRVTETYVSCGEVCVATEGFKYFRPGQWFWSEEEARENLQKA
ncbi:hypothetical protein KC887_07370 [Candidatus Kaiserbacteria bacterium]|nr:hypothetical protein [Candidatus Kaiserbacteria bacterium]